MNEPLEPGAASIDEVDPAGSWARFRVDELRRRLALLRDLRQGDVPLSIGLPGRSMLRAVLWAVSEPQALLYYSVRSEDHVAPPLTALLAEPQLWAAAQLGDDKLQWPVYGLAATPATAGQPGNPFASQPRLVLTAQLPTHLYLLPRREGLRLRQGRQGVPQLRLRHPLAPTQALELAALDIGPGGCAWWKPAAMPPLAPGLVIEDAELHLAPALVLRADLLVQHVTRLPQQPDAGARIGCSWQAMPPADAERLRSWLEAGTGRHDLISLQLD